MRNEKCLEHIISFKNKKKRLKGWTGKKLNWFKCYETNQKHMTQENISHKNWLPQLKSKRAHQANYVFVYVGSVGSPRILNKQRANLHVLLNAKGPKHFIPLYVNSNFFIFNLILLIGKTVSETLAEFFLLNFSPLPNGLFK